MQPTDKAAFGITLTGVLQEMYDKPVSSALLVIPLCSVRWACLQAAT